MDDIEQHDEEPSYEMDETDGERFHLDDSSMAAFAPLPAAEKPYRPGKGSAASLRRELNERAFLYARRHGLLHDATPHASPSVVFGPQEGPQDAPRHGNFLDATYQAIVADPAWALRLTKAHTAHRRVWPRAAWRWRELDAATSSDALLMNVFCYPGVLDGRSGQGLRALLGVGPGLRPEFGYKPRIPIAGGRRGAQRFDRTEIDLRLGSLLLEAKLTETAAGPTPRALLDRYPAFAETFDPTPHPHIPGYQMHRGVLAAVAEPATPPASFCLLADQRRPDLLEAWYAVLSTVRSGELRCRLQMLTWQEVAATLPAVLRNFLAEKYGILPV